MSNRIDSFFDLFSAAQDKTARELAGRAVIDALIRSSKDAECQDCGHKVSQHGPYGCEVEQDKVYGDCEFPRAGALRMPSLEPARLGRRGRAAMSRTTSRCPGRRKPRYPT